MPPDGLPTADEFFAQPTSAGAASGAPAGGGQKQLPTADQFFAKPESKPSAFETYGAGATAALSGGMPASSPLIDEYMNNSSMGRVLDAFGQGAKDAWGTEPLGLDHHLSDDQGRETQETVADALRKHGVLPGFKQSYADVMKAYNEAVLRPLAAGIDAALRGTTALWTGGQEALRQFGREVQATFPINQPEVLKGKYGVGNIGEMFEAGAGVPEAFFGMPGGIGPHAPPEEIARARALGVIGEGEEGWKGYTPANMRPEDQAAIRRRWADAYSEYHGEPAPPEPEAPPAPAAEPGAPERPAAPTVDTVARQIAPDVFKEYDALQLRRDTYRRWIQDLGEQREASPEATAAQQRIDEILGKVNGVEDRLTNAGRGRLEAARDDLDRAQKADTPDMAKLRQEMQRLDYRMRDLAPQVSEATRRVEAEMARREPAELRAVPDEALNGDLLSNLERAFDREGSENETMPLANAGARPEEVAAWEKAGLATDGRVSWEQLQHALTERARRSGKPAALEEKIEPLTVEKYVDDYLSGRGRESPEHQQFAANNGPAIEDEFTRRLSGQPTEEVAGAGAAAPGEPAKVGIAADVSRKLVAAGRPKEEAEAGGALHAYHYAARAARFKGMRGTAEDLYRREGPDIVAGRGAGASREKEFAQPARPEDKQRFARDLARAASRQLKVGERIRVSGVPRALQALGSLFQGARGKITLKNDRAVITLFRDADASTFLHETGHAWLEELMRDAADDRAPDDLIQDAKTVRDWLGAEEGQQITRRQHEKWARGFERYLMEGRAPTKALAGIFEKFRRWLTRIYQTVAKLRAPITDDIRDVFDRLIAVNPEGRHTVVAPEPAVEDLANRHEDLAEKTPPEGANEAAEQVRRETDRAALSNPETRNAAAAIGASSEAEGPGGPGEGPEAGGGGVEGQPEPRRPQGGGGPRAVGSGGVAAEAEGAAARGEPGEEVAPPARKGAPATEVPATAHGEFEPTSDLVDKAGNIVLDNLNVAEDVKQAVRSAAARNGDFVAQRRGVVSDADAMHLADAMGLKVGDLNRRQIGEAWNKEQIFALEKLFIQSATAVRDAARKAVEAGSEEAMMAYGEVEARHQLILDTVQAHASGVRAEAGRALQAYAALKRLAGHAEAEATADILKTSAGRTLFQLKQRAQALAGLNTPAQVAGALNEMNKPSLGRMALEIFKNWLISGPITHLTYAIGNAALAAYKAVPETAAEALAGAVREKITGQQGSRARLGEVRAQVYAMWKGQRDGWAAAWDAFKAGQTMLLPHEELDMMTKAERKKYADLISQGISHEDAVVRLGMGGPGSTPFTNTKMVPNKIFGANIPLGSAVRFPGERMVAPIHSYFRTIGYLQSIARQAYRMAYEEGLSGDAFNRRLADLTQRPTEEMMTAARDEATQQTLMGHGGELTQRVSKLVNWEPTLPVLGPTKPLSFIDPFVTIASNIMEQSVLERGPAGVLSTKLREDMKGKNGPLAQDTAIARVALGTSLTAVGMGLAAEGTMNPSEPSDPREAAVWRMNHGMPHSLRFGDVSIDMSRLGVLGFQLGIAADLHHVAHNFYQMLEGDPDANLSKITSLLVHSFTQNFLDEGFMRGPSDLIKALTDEGRYGGRYVQNLLSSMVVPYSIGMAQLARQVDPYARQARTLLDTIKAKVPFWSESLYPRRDIWGRPMPNREYRGVYVEEVMNDPVNKELEKLGVFPAYPQRKIRGVELTDKQYDEYSAMAGTLSKKLLDRIVNQPGWQNMPADVRRKVILSTINNAHEQARSAIIMKSVGTENDIMKKASEAKQKPQKQPAPAPGPLSALGALFTQNLNRSSSVGVVR